jgi:hypothetical protein
MRSSVSLFDHPEADLCAAPSPSAQAGHSATSVAPVMPTPGTGNISARLPPTHVFDRHVYDPGHQHGARVTPNRSQSMAGHEAG